MRTLVLIAGAALAIGACSPQQPQNEYTVDISHVEKVPDDYDYTKPHDNTSTAQLKSEVEDPASICEGLDDEQCAQRTASRQLELDERKEL